MICDKNDKIGWFKQARFGLFIHWGLYAATEGYWNGKETEGIGEWIASKERIPLADYEKFAEKMTCEKFDPAYWAKLAKNAGMQYCVFTAKHHEGFAMFDTSFDDYSIVQRSPYKKDVTKAIVEAMRAEGITPCLYYSHALDFHEENAMGNTWDFHVPEGERDFQAYINNKCKHQLGELMTNYGDIGMVWMDVPKGITDEMALDVKAFIKKHQPDCLVSGRLAYDHRLADFGCFGDNQIPAVKPEGCWETAATMNNTWGYKRDDHNFKSTKEVIELLCDLLSKGTNLLLNIGPKPNGEIPDESVHILQELAEWYKINGEAVNGTEGSPFGCDFSFGGASYRSNVIYLYVYEPRESIDIYGINNRVVEAMVLGGPQLTYHQDELLHIDLKNVNFGKYVTVIKLILDDAVDVKEGIFQQEKNKIILPAAIGKIIKNEKALAAGQLKGDDALEAENLNLANCADMEVNLAGIIENWRSEQNYLQWEFEVEEDGAYDVFLYTITQKYKKWTGGHKVYFECNGVSEGKMLTADKASTGANQKYFGETGSFLGKVNIKAGKQTFALYAEQINPEDLVGLAVSKLVLVKSNDANIPQITMEEVKEGLRICTDQILHILPEFTDKFQSPASENLFYRQIENVDWTNAFWTGEIWLAYEFSKEECLKDAALLQCESFYERIKNRIAVDSHDMGFLYSLSCVAAFKIIGNERAKEAALMAADNLLTMFRAKGNFIQSVNQPENKKEYRMIVDTLLNLPLLYWASEITGDEKYKNAAITHFNTTKRYIVREDGSTAQAARFDNETGEHLVNYTRQGYSDDSAWSRGQAWAIYGPAIMYKYTKLEACKDMFDLTAPYFLQHLPKDMVAYFDLTFTEGDEWPRDSSAAAIAACGMLEMAKYLEQEKAEIYISSAKKILKSLFDNYMVRDYKSSNGILKHATYCCKTPYNAMSRDWGKDECCSFGDYFYMEALTRLYKDWEMYW